ncbi:hypothetical protein GCM10009642_58090 [Nocardiopsis metallicus]
MPHTTTAALTEPLTIGSLCTGYAELDMGVAAALGGNARLAWVADNDPHVTRLLTHRFPGVRNLGDLSSVRWSDVERPNVLNAGFPCQDISAAGRGAGIEKGTRSSVWTFVMDAVRHLRPNLLVLENVAALRWKGRGLDRVLADLARTGYDARWCCVRASDLGACHRRERLFLAAHPVRQRRAPGARRPAHPQAAGAAGAGGRCALPPAAHPRVRTHPHCAHQTHRQAPAHPAGQRRHQGQPPATEFVRAPHTALRSSRHSPHRSPGLTPPFAYAWGEYAPAIHRWEEVLGRTAPPPTERGTRGQPRLSAALVEWMMGLPAGWVTDPDLGLPRTAQLHILGNGVVPQQAAVAMRHLIAETNADFGGSG